MQIKIADEFNRPGEPLAVRNDEMTTALLFQVLDSGGKSLRTIRLSVTYSPKVGERHSVIRDHYRLNMLNGTREVGIVLVVRVLRLSYANRQKSKDRYTQR